MRYKPERALKHLFKVISKMEISVTTQAHEGIETRDHHLLRAFCYVTTQAHKGIEIYPRRCRVLDTCSNNSSP